LSVEEQITLATPVTMSGVALHSGVQSTIRILPAPANSGVTFVRTDVRDEERSCIIQATPEAVVDSRLGTRLSSPEGVSVHTVEHLMAAFSICEIDNAIVEIDEIELPILDGSALPYVAAFDDAGLKTQNAPREHIVVSRPFELQSGDRYIGVFPALSSSIEVSIEFDDRAIGAQSLCVDLDDKECLRRRLAPARTFCLLRDVEAMRTAGFALGGTLENALVVDGARILNPGGLRDAQEFALHKALDLLGDLRLLGKPIRGRIVARRCGHEFNAEFARKFAAATNCWENEQTFVRPVKKTA
jgi:UDP-3-O-[3-hydroxymyristoyl] N-acetylglucosamine deacetylase